MSIITLTTDYGLKDHFVGALKGKIISKIPEITIVDISHDIDPFNTLETSYIVSAAYSSFPKGTIHLIGVDSERNKENQHIVMQWNNHFFICADNGILSMLSQKIKPQKMVSINIHNHLSQAVSDLDVFVEVACHLARGGVLNLIGTEISEIKNVTEIQAVVNPELTSIKGNVIYIDHFGNVVTNITKSLFSSISKGRSFEIIMKKNKIKSISTSYSAIANNDKFELKNYEGQKLAIFNEAGFLEIAIFRSNPLKVGSASSLLGLNYRDSIEILFY